MLPAGSADSVRVSIRCDPVRTVWYGGNRSNRLTAGCRYLRLAEASSETVKANFLLLHRQTYQTGLVRELPGKACVQRLRSNVCMGVVARKN